MFAKLYGTGADQVLVVLDTDDEGAPCIKFSCKPEGAGVCTFTTSFDDSEDGQAKAESIFVEIDEDKARDAVDKTIMKFMPIGG